MGEQQNHVSPRSVSIVVPAYNEESEIETTIRGVREVMATSDLQWELLVVDDGSEDDTRLVLDEFQIPRIRYFRLETNQGRGAARKYALEQAVLYAQI